MSYTNSPLVSYTRLSPNHSGERNHSIDTVTIHCVVGQSSVEGLGEWFSKASTDASSNYGIGYDGRIGLYVEEKNRSWCTSSSSNDHRAITIEVASDAVHPYKVKDVVMESLVNLLTDICKRNNIKQLLWKADKNLIGQVDKQNMSVHRWFSSTACPGEYLYNKHSEIAAEVNKRLSQEMETTTNDIESIVPGTIVSINPGATYYNGVSIPTWVQNKQWIVSSVSGDRVVIDKSTDGANSICSPIHAQYLTIINDTQSSEDYFVGFHSKVDAENLVATLKSKGYTGAFVVKR